MHKGGRIAAAPALHLFSTLTGNTRKGRKTRLSKPDSVKGLLSQPGNLVGVNESNDTQVVIGLLCKAQDVFIGY